MVHLFGYTDEIFKLKEFSQQKNINVPFYYFRFIYADLFGFDMWTAEEIPYMSGNFSSERVNFTCTASSPIPCSFVNSTTIPAFGYIYSFGQDNNKDVLLLASTGVYRIVRSHRCGYTCNLDPYYPSPDDVQPPSYPPTPSPVEPPSYQQPTASPIEPPSSSPVAAPTSIGPF